jgi:proton glutamate symport protein
MRGTETQRPWYTPALTTRIMIGLVVGVLIGWLRPEWGNAIYFLRDIFLNLIKSIIGPLVFSTLVVGIAGGGELRKVGRMGVKALIYFEVITTAALFLGLAVVNVIKPGVGVSLGGNGTDAIQKIGDTHPRTLIETLVHVFPRAWSIRWRVATCSKSSRSRCSSRSLSRRWASARDRCSPRWRACRR